MLFGSKDSWKCVLPVLRRGTTLHKKNLLRSSIWSAVQQSWYSFSAETKLPLSGNKVLCRCLKTENDYRRDCRQPVVIFALAQKAFSSKSLCRNDAKLRRCRSDSANKIVHEHLAYLCCFSAMHLLCNGLNKHKASKTRSCLGAL